MIELEWLAHGDPRRLLEILRNQNPSDRKRRLFLCACGRAALSPASDEHLAQALEVAERYADGRAEEDERAFAEAVTAREARMGVGGVGPAVSLAALAAPPPLGALADAAEVIREWAHDPAAARLRQCAILRDLFGNPFRPRRLEAAWLRWNDRAVPRLARALYDDGRFADLPILADALEEAGCDDADLVGHCRGGGHVRGCWAVDLLLGRG
jgi:hypothetical protein